jgi:hypothetical protein
MWNGFPQDSSLTVPLGLSDRGGYLTGEPLPDTRDICRCFCVVAAVSRTEQDKLFLLHLPRFRPQESNEGYETVLFTSH